VKIRISAAMVTAVALAGAAFLVLATPVDAKPGASGTVSRCADDPGRLQWRTVAQVRERGSREKQH
jgi:ABC-type Fe2+-enterobactin transport system substrate-binding protein